MKKKINNMLFKFKRALKNGAWGLLILMGIESFTFNMPSYLVFGIMAISISFVFFPWLNEILNLLNIKMSFVNKLIIIISNMIVSFSMISIDEKNYYKCILPIIIIIFIWIFMILYLKIKKNKV